MNKPRENKTSPPNNARTLALKEHERPIPLSGVDQISLSTPQCALNFRFDDTLFHFSLRCGVVGFADPFGLQKFDRPISLGNIFLLLPNGCAEMIMKNIHITCLGRYDPPLSIVSLFPFIFHFSVQYISILDNLCDYFPPRCTSADPVNTLPSFYTLLFL